MEKSVTEYLRLLKIPVSKKYCEKLILSHPDYPSIVAISDAFEKLGICAHVGRIDKDLISQVDYPYLLHINRYNGEFLTIKDQESLISQSESLKHWSGVIIKAEKTNEITDLEHNKEFTKDVILKIVAVLFLISLSVTIIYPLIVMFSLMHSTLLLTSIGGVIIEFLLVAKDLGMNFKAVESFCSVTKDINCDIVLNSDYSNVFGNVKISDFVISYFVFQLIIIGFITPFVDNPSSYLLVLAVISLFTIPIISLSIYYQYVKIENWCKLCLLVSGVLIIQSCLFIFGYFQNYYSFGSFYFLTTLFLFLISIIVTSSVMILKIKLSSINESLQNEVHSNRIKYDPRVFTHLLFTGRQVDIISFKNEMIIGNENAPIKLVMASNLFCDPCKKSHIELNDLITTYPDKVCFINHFLPLNNLNKIEIDPWVYIMKYWYKHIQNKPNESMKTAKFIHDWYEAKDIERFQIQYPMSMSKNMDFDMLNNIKSKYYK